MTKREFVAAHDGIDWAHPPIDPVVAEGLASRCVRLLMKDTTLYDSWLDDGLSVGPRSAISARWINAPEDLRHRKVRAHISPVSASLDLLRAWPRKSSHGLARIREIDRWITAVVEPLKGEQRHLDLNKLGQNPLIQTLQGLHLAGGFGVFLTSRGTSVEVLVLRRPAIRFNDRWQIHDEHGPAVVWPGSERNFYLLHDVLVDQRFVTDPSSVTPRDISETQNQEVRRILIERYGWARYLHDVRAEQIDSSEYGTLWNAQIPGDPDTLWRGGVLILDVRDASTNRRFFLRVPPRYTTAKSAVAWTFGVKSKDYNPIKET